MKLIKKSGPFIESPQSTQKIMRNIIIALIPIIIFTFYVKGISTYIEYKELFWIFITVLITTLTSFITELLYQIIIVKRRKKEEILFDIKHNYSFMIGLLISLLLPYGVTIPVMIVGALSATIIGKLLFGGFGNNIFNPVLIGMLIVILFFGGSYQALSKQHNYDNTCNEKMIYNLCIEDAIVELDDDNLTILPSIDDISSGNIPGSPADISSIICIVSLIFLIATKSIKWRIPIFYLGTVIIISTILSLFIFKDMTFVLFQILSGGLLFYATFIAPDSVTTPVTHKGQIILGISLGILTMYFRLLTPYYYEATIFSILILNMATRLFDKIAIKSQYKNLKEA